MAAMAQRLRLAAESLRGRHDTAAVMTFHKPPRLAVDRRSLMLVVITLILGATADYIAFLQAIAIAIQDLNNWQLPLLVSGITGIALALAHQGGAALRDRSDKVGRGRGVIAACAIVGWAGLGAMAFVIRWHRPVTKSSTEGTLGLGAHGSGSSGGASPLVVALLFLTLYLGTGALTIATTYVEHDAARTDYRRARSRLIKAQWRSHRNNSAHALAVGALDRAIAREEHDRTRYKAQGTMLKAFAAELKELVRQCIAIRLQDPAATDGLFPPPFAVADKAKTGGPESDDDFDSPVKDGPDHENETLSKSFQGRWTPRAPARLGLVYGGGAVRRMRERAEEVRRPPEHSAVELVWPERRPGGPGPRVPGPTACRRCSPPTSPIRSTS